MSMDLLCRRDGAHRASIGASTAINANCRVDLVDVALADCTCRALRKASTASYAITGNFVSHITILLNKTVKMFKTDHKFI